MAGLRKKHRKTLQKIFERPVNTNIKWQDIEKLFEALGADVTEREGSRVAVKIGGQVAIYHRPHPNPDTDKGAVSSVRRLLEKLGVKP